MALPPNVRGEEFPSQRPNTFKDVLFYFRHCRKEDIDCVLATHAGLTAAAVGGFLARVPLRCGWAHTLLGGYLYGANRSTLRLYPQLARRRFVQSLLSYVLAVSNACREDLVKNWRVPRRRVRVVLNAIRRAPGELLDQETEPGRIVCASRLVKGKGQEVLLRALRQVIGTHPEAHCDFLGDGPEMERLRGMAAKLGVGLAARFHGAVSPETVRQQMAKAAVAVLPSLDEAFGLVVAEALSVGTPVVASRVGGIPEILRDGVEGFLVKPGDAGELAAAISKLLDSEELRQRMKHNALRRFEEEFELEGRVRELCAWLEEEARRRGIQDA